MFDPAKLRNDSNPLVKWFGVFLTSAEPATAIQIKALVGQFFTILEGEIKRKTLLGKATLDMFQQAIDYIAGMDISYAEKNMILISLERFKALLESE